MIKECDKKDATLAFIIQSLAEEGGVQLHGKQTDVNRIKGSIGSQLTIKTKVPITKSLIDALNEMEDTATISLTSLSETVNMFKQKQEAMENSMKKLLDMVTRLTNAVDNFAAENCESLDDVKEFEETYNVNVSNKLKEEFKAIEEIRGFGNMCYRMMREP